MNTTTVSVRGGAFSTECIEAGSGSPLLLLHGWNGVIPDTMIQGLARTHRVIAPLIPGYGNSTGDEHLNDFVDLIYWGLDFMDAEGLKDVPIVAHSLGAMLAAELAAAQPDRISKLVLIAPFGLWNEQHPVVDFFVESPAGLAAAMYANPASDAAQAAASVPQDDAGRVAFYYERAKSLRIAAKYLWPIPNRGLARRSHRISAPTLLVWGEQDRICPPALASDFQAAIKNTSVAIIPGAGHLPGAEQPQALLSVINGFLA